MSWWYFWVVSFCQFPYLTFGTKFEPQLFEKIFFHYVSVSDPLSISVVGGRWCCSKVTVGDNFPRIVFSLENKKMFRLVFFVN